MWRQPRLFRSHREDVILMQTRRNLRIPNTASPQFVRIAAFSHEHIAFMKHAARGFRLCNENRLHYPQIHMARLNISDAKIRVLAKWLPTVILSKRDSRLNAADSFQRQNVPMLRNLSEPRDTRRLQLN